MAKSDGIIFLSLGDLHWGIKFINDATCDQFYSLLSLVSG